MKQHITLGSSPVSEVCAQVGDPNYEERSIIECEVYKKQLDRYFQEMNGPGRACTLKVKSFPHDFGDYLEVVAIFEETNSVAVRHALWFENHLPEEWDAISRQELGL